MRRNAMPPSVTPGDGRYGRQGTSLLHIAGEKTRTSAPWAKRKASGNGSFLLYRNLYGLYVTRVENGSPQR